MIESVFAITKAPTKSATPPKASRNFCRNERKPLTSSLSFFACEAAVRTVAVGGSTGLISLTSFDGATPDLPAMRMSSSFPSFWNSRWAVGRSKIAIVAPPIEETEANFATPLIRNGRSGPSAATPIVSPTANCLSSAVFLSIATWPDPEGQRPLTSFSGLKRVSVGSTLNPRLGAPPVEIVFPFRPISRVCSSATLPTAASMLGSCFTFVRTLSGNPGDEVAPESPEKATLPVMTASLPSYDWVKIVSKPLLIVSVRT